MRFVALHKKNDAAQRIAINPLMITRIAGDKDAEGNAYTVIHYSSDNYPKYDEVTEDFETVLSKINISLNISLDSLRDMNN